MDPVPPTGPTGPGKPGKPRNPVIPVSPGGPFGPENSAILKLAVYVVRAQGGDDLIELTVCPELFFICATRVLAMVLCLSVCLSHVGVLSKRPSESSWFLACRLISAYPTLCYLEIQVYPKKRTSF